jgi:hypothetical protein
MRRSFLLLAIALIGGGCSTAKHSLGTGSLDIGETCVQYVTFDRTIALAVWGDAKGDALAWDASSGNWRYSGRFYFAPHDRAHWFNTQYVNWEAKTTDGKCGSVIINDAQYKLEDGALFLVTTHGDAPVVRQVSIDLSALHGTAESFEAVAKDHAEVKEFLTQASGKK